jgi:hypothetical protein
MVIFSNISFVNRLALLAIDQAKDLFEKKMQILEESSEHDQSGKIRDYMTAGYQSLTFLNREVTRNLNVENKKFQKETNISVEVKAPQIVINEYLFD